MGLLLAALSALLYGSADFAGGVAARRSPALSVVVVSQIFGILLALVAAPIVGPNGARVTDITWGAGAGLAGAVGLVALYRGIATGLVSVVSPVAALLGAAVPLTFGIASGEKPDLAAWLGVSLCLPALALITIERGGKSKSAAFRSTAFGIASGAGFGIFFICISRPSADAGLWPLVAARATSISALTLAAVIAGKNPFRLERGIAVVVTAGLFDMAANVAYILSTRVAMFALATVIASLYPAPTVVLGAVVFRERLGPLRATGLLCALAGVALISMRSA